MTTRSSTAPAVVLLCAACSEPSLRYDNPPPVATIVSHGDGDTVLQGPTALVGTATDAHVAPEDLRARWYLGGEVVCDDAPPDADGRSSCTVDLPAGDARVTLEVRDLDGVAASDTVSLEVVSNRPPVATITSVQAGVTWPGDLPLPLSGWVVDAEDPPEALTAWWESSLDGRLDAAPDADGIVSGSAVLSGGEHELTLWVEDTLGARGSDSVSLAVLGNEPPSVSIVTPGLGALVNEGSLVSLEGTVADPDQDPSTLDLVWESDVDGTLSTTAADGAGRAEAFASDLSPGEHVLTLTATDDDGRTGADSVLFVVNALPGPPVVSITPAAPRTGDELVAHLDAPATDPEGEVVEVRYEWSRDGTVVWPWPTVPSNMTRKGQVWQVAAIPSDPHGTGAPGVAQVTITNTPPTAVSVSLTPGQVYTDTVLAAAGSATDPDGDPLTWTWRWWVDGVDTGVSTATLDGAVWFDKHQQVSAEGQVFDGVSLDSVMSPVVEVQNSPPEAPEVGIEPTLPADGDDLVCAVVAPSLDADGDPVTYAWAWEADGVPSGAVSTTVSPDDTIAAADRGSAERWTCLVFPDDGEDLGDPGEASCAPAGLELDHEETLIDGGMDDPVWTLSPGLPEVVQEENSDPAVYLTHLDTALGPIVLEVVVEDSFDDDYIGWTLGYEAGDAVSASADWMLIDWKRHDQNWSGGWGREGLALSRVTGAVTDEDDLWRHVGPVSEIARGSSLGGSGWAVGTVHLVEIDATPARIDVWVDGVLELSETGAFPSGRLGLYTFSQEDVRFTLISPLGDPVCQ